MRRLQMAATMLLPVVLLALIWVLLGTDQPIDPKLLSTHIEEFSTRSSRYQLLTYVGFLTLLAIWCLFVLLRKRAEPLPVDSWGREAVPVYLAILFWVALFLLGDFSWSFAAGFVLALTAVYLINRRMLGGSFFTRSAKVFHLVAAAYIVAYVLLPFFTPLVIYGAPHLAWVDSHYAMTVLPGFDFVCCSETGTVERSNYGLSMVLLTALGYKALAAMIGVQDGMLPFLVRFYQVIALGLLTYAVYLLNRKHFLFVASLTIFLTATLNTLGEANYLPNQSGIRYIPFLIGIIVLIREMRRGTPRPFVLAVAASLLIFLSPETGIALFVGYSVFLVLSKFDAARPLRSAAGSLGAFFALFSLGFFALSLLATREFYSGASTDLFYFFRLFSSGYGGLVSKLNVFAALLLFFASAALIRGFTLAKRGKVPPVAAYQAAIAAIILVWLPYYMNRMQEWNLWFQAALIMFLFAPKIRPSLLKVLFRKFDFRFFHVATATAMIAALVFLSGERLYRDTINSVPFFDYCPPALTPFQKYCFAGRGAGEIGGQLDAISRIPDKENYLVVSHLSNEVRLLGFNERFPWYEPFGEIPRQGDLDVVARWIDANGPKYLLVDNPSSNLSRTIRNRTDHLMSIIRRVEAYQPVGNGSNWIVFARKPA